MTNYDRMLQYFKAWTDGAGGRPMDEKRANHPENEFRELYGEGYMDGQKARNEATHRAAERFQVNLSPIRPMR